MRETDGLGEGDASPLLHEEVQYVPDVVAVRPGAREQVRELEPHAGAAVGRFYITVETAYKVAICPRGNLLYTRIYLITDLKLL